jgi:hypothetical protein
LRLSDIIDAKHFHNLPPLPLFSVAEDNDGFEQSAMMLDCFFKMQLENLSLVSGFREFGSLNQRPQSNVATAGEFWLSAVTKNTPPSFSASSAPSSEWLHFRTRGIHSVRVPLALTGTHRWRSTLTRNGIGDNGVLFATASRIGEF